MAQGFYHVLLLLGVGPAPVCLFVGSWFLLGLDRHALCGLYRYCTKMY